MKGELHKLHSRPGMYLASYDGIDAASFIVNFLIAVFESQESDIPNVVNIVTAGQHYFIQADGCSLPQTARVSEDLSSLFDISQFQEPFYDRSHVLGYLRPIVWFSEYCLVDTTVGKKIFRQAFLHGNPLAQISGPSLDSNVPNLGFLFTLPFKLFEITTLEVGRLRNAIDTWEKRRLERTLSSHGIKLTLQKQWFEQSRFHHSLRITPKLNISERQDTG